MNKVFLIGRLVKNPEMRTTPSGIGVVANTIAVTRKIKSQNGEYESDFINFVSFSTTAELINRYCSKGDKIGLEGRIQTRNYENQEGNRVYVTEVVVDSIEFLQEKKEQNNTYNDYGSYQDSYKPIQKENSSINPNYKFDIDDSDLPF